MKRLYVYKILLAVLLAVCVAGVVFYHRFSTRSSADELYAGEKSRHTDVMATSTDGIAAMAGYEISYEDVDCILSGDVVFYNGMPYTRHYTVHKDGVEYRAYCGDHKKNEVKSTDKVAFSVTNNRLLQKAFLYGPGSEYEWSGFKGVSADHRQLIMTLTLNYIRHGQYFDVIDEFYKYISETKRDEIVLQGDQADIEIIDDGSKENYGNYVSLKDYTGYVDKKTGEKRRRTRIMRCKADAENGVRISVPADTWLHIRKSGEKEFTIHKTGKVTIMGGDRFFFSAEKAHKGTGTVKSGKGIPGVTVYTVDSTQVDDDQQLLFGTVASSSISMDIEWTGEKPVLGKFSLHKTDRDSGAGVGEALYNIEMEVKNGTQSLRTLVAQIETDENGHGIVVMSEYGGLGTYEITDMPFGTYRIYEERAPYNYERNSAVAQLVINEEGEFLSVDGKEVSTSTELEISWETWDKVISGKIDLSIYKQDAETGDKSQGDAVLSGAEFTVNYYRNFYNSVDELPEKPDQSWTLKTDDSGKCGLEDVVLQTGTITVQETKAPEGYTLVNSIFKSTKNGNIIKDSSDGIYLDRIEQDGDTVRLVNGYELVVGNHVVRGDFKFKKVVAEDGTAIANVRFLVENSDGTQSAEITTDANGEYSSSADDIWFGDGKPDKTKGSLPYGEYTLTELRCDANKGKYKSIAPIKFKIDSDECVLDLGDIVDERMPEIESVAKNSEDGSKFIDPDAETVDITDTVSMKGLDIGHRYKLSGSVVSQESGRPLGADGSTSEKCFTADAEEMTVDVNFRFSTDSISGSALVCYEVLTDEDYEGEVVASHEDVNLASQTVYTKEKEKIRGSISVHKTDDILETPLADAEFTLYRASDHEKLMTKKTDKAGSVEFTGLEPGEYYIKETRTPKGYIADPGVNSIPVSVPESADEPPVINVKNHYGMVHILKTDQEDGSPLAGAVFGIYDDRGALIAKAESEENGQAVFYGLARGTYSIEELAAPEGYEKTDKKIQIDTSKNEYTMDDPVIITNQKIKEHPSPDTPNTPDTPDTGDRDPVSKVILLMCFAVVSVAGIVFYRKKFTGESK